jgi:hypothetical protein
MSFFTSTFYRWLDPESLLIARPGSGNWVYRIWNVRTGATRTLDGLSAALSQVHVGGTILAGADAMPGIISRVVPSPDGRYVLFYSQTRRVAFVADMATQRLIRDRSQPGGEVAWIAGTRKWIEITRDGRADTVVVHGVAGGRTTSFAVEPSHDEPQPGFVEATRAFKADRSGFAVLELRTQFPAVLLVNRRTFAGPLSRSGGFQWGLPSVASLTDLGSVVLAPNCRRLAWVALNAGRDGRAAVGLWVSDLRGRVAREVGAVVLPQSLSYYRTHPAASRTAACSVVNSVAWTPDSKCVSYIVDGELFRVRVR